ncbi:MAG: SPOR domain-containing protein [Gammaproteobacteria bacterium]|nr:SPOR domain-containing protein [Gammaproteobacteria bacterium]
MADNNSVPEQNFNPRHRIVGAIVVVSLAVILVPMVLDKNEWEPQQPSAGPAETQVIVTRVEDMRRSHEKVAADSGSSTPAPDPVAEEPKSSQSTQTKTITVKPEPQSQPEKIQAAATASKPAVAPASHQAAVTKKPAGQNAGWVIQLGTFANPKNVERIRDQLSAGGFKVSTEPVQLRSGPAVRVRVGPYDRKAQADSMQQRILDDTGIKGAVLAVR